MATQRTRTRDEVMAQTGSCERPPFGITYRTGWLGMKETCIDVVGNREGVNPFYLAKTSYSHAAVNGERRNPTTGALITKCSEFPVMGPQAAPSPVSKFPKPNSADLQGFAWDVLAACNPNQPHVSVPTALAELRDIPLLVKDFGDDLLSRVARGYVSYRFAIKPMIGDLRKLFGFVDAVKQRLEYLNRLAEGKNMKRRCVLDSHTEGTDWSNEKLLNSVGPAVYGKDRIRYSMKMWGTVQYKAASHAVIPTHWVDQTRLAIRLTAGVTTHGALKTAWELAPWSWLTDWFLNIGDMIDATDNTVPLTFQHLCVMRHTVARRSWQVTRYPDWVSVTGTQFEQTELKERWLVAPLVPFNVSIPALNAGQWSILGALGALKAKTYGNNVTIRI